MEEHKIIIDGFLPTGILLKHMLYMSVCLLIQCKMGLKTNYN